MENSKIDAKPLCLLKSTKVIRTMILPRNNRNMVKVKSLKKESPFPGESATLQTQPLADGMKTAMIPHFSDKKLLLIKLRDFPKMEGMSVMDYSFTNLVKGNLIKKHQTSASIPVSNSTAFSKKNPNSSENSNNSNPNTNSVPIQNVYPKFPAADSNHKPAASFQLNKPKSKSNPK
jgi:hypothetical protein